jgi:hypothetical protein
VCCESRRIREFQLSDHYIAGLRRGLTIDFTQETGQSYSEGKGEGGHKNSEKEGAGRAESAFTKSIMTIAL